MRRALVTGSAGFLGRHLVAGLAACGWRVAAVDVAPAVGVDCLEDVFRISAARYDLVVHAAARDPHRAAIDTRPASTVYNRLLDAAMFDWAIRTKQRRVLYLSSCAALDERPDGYGQAKLAGEAMAELARQCGTPVTVVRPYSGYGSDQDERFPFGAFVGRARRREDPFVVWGDGGQVRDWVHVDDLVGACLALVEDEVDGPVSVCTGVGTSMLELATMVCAAAGYQPEFEPRLDLPPGVPERVGDPSSLHRHYTPKVDLAEGVRRAIAGN